MKKTLPILLLCLLTAVPALSHTITGKVAGVSDGDTITVLDAGKRQHKTRLYGIDCPERGQAFGKAAKKHTGALVAAVKKACGVCRP